MCLARARSGFIWPGCRGLGGNGNCHESMPIRRFRQPSSVAIGVRRGLGRISGVASRTNWLCFARWLLCRRLGLRLLLRRQRCGGFGAAEPTDLLQLVEGSVEALLDPALVQAQPLQHLRAAEVRDHDPSQRRVARVGAVVRPEVQVRQAPLGVGGALAGQQRVEDLRLEAVGPPQPPGQADDPLGQHRLQNARRVQLRQQLRPIGFELPRVLAADDRLAGEQPVRHRVLRNHRLARRRPRPRRLLRVQPIRPHLRFRSHMQPPHPRFTIDHLRFTISFYEHITNMPL